MKKIKCMIIDDEPLAQDLLEGYVLKTPFLDLSEKCGDAYKALEHISLNKIDLLFLDIQMPGLNGLELSRLLNRDIHVIFTTAFQQYAIEGFKVDAIDYLLKPISYDEFLVAAIKAQDRILMKSIFANKKQAASVVFVKSDNKMLKVELDKILYIDSFKDHIEIQMTDSEKPIHTSMKLIELEGKLPKERFLHIPHSHIVNLGRIEELERSQVIEGNERISLRDQYIDKLDQYIMMRNVQA